MTTVRINHRQRQVLAFFAAGHDQAAIARTMGLDDLTVVIDTIRELGGNDIDRARRLVDDYDRRATAVAAAKGIAPPPLVSAHTRAAIPAAAPTAPTDSAESPQCRTGGVEQLLARAEASDRVRTKALTRRVAEMLADLAGRLAVEDAEREAAERVARLRRELADAEQALRTVRRGDAAAAATAPPADAAGDQERVDARAVRAWAHANGIDVNPAGAVRRDVVERWRAATGRAAGMTGVLTTAGGAGQVTS